MLLMAIRCSNLPLLSLPACPSIALPAAQLEEALSFCIAGYEVRPAHLPLPLPPRHANM